MELETMDARELRRMQSEKLQTQLAYVARQSPFYRERWREAGVEAEFIHELEDLAKLPFTIKDDLRKAQIALPPFGDYLACKPEDVVIICASSGTTGRAVYMPLTYHDQERWAEVLSRMYWFWGVRRTDVFAHLATFHMFTAGLPTYPAILKLGAAMIPIGARAGTDRALMIMRDLRPTAMALTPSFALYLSQQVKEILGIEARELGIKILATGAEPLLPAVREELNDIWQLRVFNMGGIGEFCTGIWSECEYHDGLHFFAGDYVYPELVVPEDGRPLAIEAGAEGEFVFTSLDRQAAPLVRFRTGDQVRIVDTAPCRCGRTSFRFEIFGRTDDMLKVRGVRVWVSAIRDVISEFRPRTTGYSQVVLKERAVVQPSPLVVEAEYAGSPVSDEIRSLKQELEGAVYARLMVKTDVRLLPTGSIERTPLKYKYIRYDPSLA